MDLKVVKSDVERWWAENPMTYGRTHGRTDYCETDQPPQRGTLEFFENVDAAFYAWNTPLHSVDGRFARLFPYHRYRGRRVLEIGCGMGTMAMNWALQGAEITAVDLNPTSIEQTQARFALMGLNGNIRQADANALPLEDASFDYVYSWGVLHHSPDLQLSMRELLRVLRPGGEFGVMLYSRHSLLYWYTIRLLEGFLHGENLFLDELGLASRYTDAGAEEGNPHTWPVTNRELFEMLTPLAQDVAIRRLGTELEYILQMMVPIPNLESWFPTGWTKALARRWGWSIWVTGKKPK